MRHIRIVFLILFTLGIAACSPAAPVTQVMTSGTDPVTAQSYHALTARTGIAEIDDVLAAVASGDDQQLRSLIQFTNAKCTLADGLGGPPKCRAGELEGASVDVLPFLGAEGSFLHKDEIDDWQGIEVTGLYAIYAVSPDIVVEEYYPAGEYAIQLLGKENQPPVVLRLSEGRIVRVDYLFGATPESLQATLESEAADVILPPRSP